MTHLRRSIAVAAVFAFSGALSAPAAADVDPTLCDDFAKDTTIDLDGFIVTQGAGPASFSIRYGQWNSTPAVLELISTFSDIASRPWRFRRGPITPTQRRSAIQLCCDPLIT